ncbi:glycosyltransferase [Neokomagataea thailandica NBRC 106555]|nr:glycosyltransferase [Neokomagataea thailandica NBRC 106555]
MLEPWLRWHGTLFGFENLTVVDNGSTDEHTLRVQARYEKRGVTIIRSHDRYEDFLNKGAIFTEIIRNWDKEGGYDFALPMDCDEFLALFLDRFSVTPSEIIAEFANLKSDLATLVTDRVLLNIPNAPGYFRPQHIPRALFHANSIETLDRGLHAPTSCYKDRCVRTPFVYLHLHNRPNYEAIKQFARQKLHTPDGQNPLDLIAHDRPLTSQASYHLLHLFQRDYTGFLAEYLDKPDIYAPDVIARMQSLGLDVKALLGQGSHPQFPITAPYNFLAHRGSERETTHEYAAFDPIAYAHENPDVATDAYYGIWPLIHFLDAGWAEGRRPNPLQISPFTLPSPH